jgi:Protein of unknown function (DUF3723)
MHVTEEKDSLLAKPRSIVYKPILYKFASLAYRLGFESEKIYSLIRPDAADEEIAHNALLKARRPARYRYNNAVFTYFIE